MPSGRQRGRILALARPVVMCLFVVFVLNGQHQQQQYQKKKGEVVVVHTTTKNEKQQHRVVRTLAFVHLGKTAGSTLTCMIGPSLKGSGKGNSRCEPSDYRPSALADSIAARFHLVPAPPIAEYDDFLVTLRHPVARIVSWFYFLHPQFPPEKRPHHIQGCDGYNALYRCYDSISALGEGRLGAIGSETESNTDQDSNHHPDPSLSCKALAKDMITGRKKCWQNYYNYEYTYGELVRDDFQEQQQQPLQSPPKNETASSDHRHPHKNNNNKKKKTNVTIYAIRTEHLEVDWNVIDALLGGSGHPSEGVVSAPRKNSWGNHAAAAIPVAAHDKTLSVRAKAYLCHLLCDEIQLYKKLLHAAVNIDARREDESLDELLQTCPEEHREVRQCRKQ